LLADLAPEIAPYTIDGLRASADQLERVRHSNMVLTIANRVREVQSLLGPDAPCVQGLVFVAHPDTVARLRVLPCGPNRRGNPTAEARSLRIAYPIQPGRDD
jgi:hypothetical protein